MRKLNTAYAIMFVGGGFRGGGHAHGVPLYRADLYETYDDAENDRLEMAKYNTSMQTAKAVRIIVSENQ